MSEREGPQPSQDEITPPKDLVEEISEKVGIVFPKYSVLDHEEYDSYKAEEDTLGRGRILKFYTENGKTQEDPSIWFIFKNGGFILNYYNAVPENPVIINNRGNSMFGPRQREWNLNELEYALERAEIHLEGLDPNNEDFQTQLVAWSAAEGKFLSMKDRINEYAAYKKMKPRERPPELKAKMIQELDIWNLPFEKSRELVIKRISRFEKYQLFDGSFVPTQEVIDSINREEGDQYITRELHLIEAQEFLLGDKHLLYRE